MNASASSSALAPAHLNGALQREDALTLEVSIVVPVYNEEENIERVHAQIASSLGALGLPFEIIYVDDGSRDKSFALLDAIAASDERVKLIRFRRNFGQTAAMAAGMDASRGRVIIPLDADGQNDPADVPRLLEKIDEGFDVVSGWRRKRQDSTLRKIPSRIANRLISRVTGVSLHDYGCSLKAYRTEVIRDVSLYGEMHRFIPAYAAMVGAKVTEIPVNHHPRIAGVSKYGFGRIFKVLLDLLVVKFLGGYGQKPIYFFGGAAMWSFGTASLFWIIAAIEKLGFNHVRVNRNPLFYIGILLFVASLMLLMMGLLAEMNMRIYYEAQSKPPYVVAETRNIRGPAL